MVGKHQIKCSSNLQSLVALSVGEAEYYAIIKGSVVGLMIRALYRDYGLEMDVEVLSDSNTAGSICSRIGVGARTKHLQVRFLWVQERVLDKDLVVKKESTLDNISDVATKSVPATTLDKHCATSSLLFS